MSLAALTLVPVGALAQSAPHVRIIDPPLRAKFENGLKRSPTLRQLVEQLELAPVLVFVNCAMKLPAQIGAHANLISSVNGLRYVRVELDCGFPDRIQVGLLAHELQHALEIASREDILDEDSMQAYYEEFGFQSHYGGRHTSYETDAAIAIQERVLSETGKPAASY